MSNDPPDDTPDDTPDDADDPPSKTEVGDMISEAVAPLTKAVEKLAGVGGGGGDTDPDADPDDKDPAMPRTQKEIEDAASKAVREAQAKVAKEQKTGDKVVEDPVIEERPTGSLLDKVRQAVWG